MKVQCSRCSVEHDLEHMDPSYALPDVVFDLSPKERQRRSRFQKDMGMLLGPEGTLSPGCPPLACFMRVLLQFHVADRLRPCRWGIWVQVERDAMLGIGDLWNKDERLDALPVGAIIANELPGYVGSRGLQGVLRFINLTDIPYFTVEGDHALAKDQRTGVSAERAVDWLLSIAHG